MVSEEFFEKIGDGGWHNLNELAVQLEVPIEKLVEFSLFLFNLGIIDCKEKKPKIKIRSEWKIIFEDEIFTTTT